jgi:glycosyltransferase involved in cell wall biosynthesis
MRRLLLVAYYFPPEPVAGALRPGYLAAHLPAFGWDVTVLTRRLEPEDPRRTADGAVITAPVAGGSVEQAIRQAFVPEAQTRSADRVPPLRRALRWAKRTLLFPDRAVGWTLAAASRGRAANAKLRFDAIVSTATPATAHVVGAMIARASGTPWIADYRDPWAGNPGAQDGAVRAAMQLAAERLVVRRAAAITTISKPIATRLEAIHHRPVTVIPNANDPGEWDGLDAIRPTRFQFCYTGSLYAEHRTPALFFAALASLRAEGDPAADADVVFLGPSNDHLMEEAHRYGLADRVTYGGVVPRARALAAQREASDLLVFLNMDPSSAFELGSKIIEYTSARRPILAFGPSQSVMREHVLRHGLGWFASNLDEAREAVRAAHRRFVAGDVELPEPPAKGYDARDLARAFAEQLEAVV